MQRQGTGLSLRDYQQDMVRRIRRSWEHGRRSVLCQMPTGTGKTLVAVAVIREFLASNDARVLIVAHRRELIAQIQQTLRRFGLPEGRVAVRSVQGMAARTRRENNPQRPVASGTAQEDFGLVVVDEAHHAVAKTYALLWHLWPEARFLGLTATPCRLGGEGLADLFDCLLTAWPVRRFIDEGWLAPYEYVSVRPAHAMLRRVAGLRRRGRDGDYQVREMATVLDTEESVEQLYDAYRTFAHGKKGIIYAIDQAHARHICAYYSARGVRIAAIDSRTPDAQRRALVRRYEDTLIYNKEAGAHEAQLGEAHRGTRAEHPDGSECPWAGGTEDGLPLDVLVNVDIFAEGYDCPAVEFVQLARPTLSLAKYLQQVGRGLRVRQGKSHVTVIDSVGLYRLFGLPSEEREWMAYYLGERRGIGDPAAIVPAEAPERMATEGWRERLLAALELEVVVRSSDFRQVAAAGREDGAGGVETQSDIAPLPDVLTARRVLPDGALLAHEGRPTVVEAVQRAGGYAVVKWRLGRTEAYAVLELDAAAGAWTDLYTRLGRDFVVRPKLAGDGLLRIGYATAGTQDALAALTWYLDLRSGEEYASRPRAWRWDFVEALEDGRGVCHLRVPEARGRGEWTFRRGDVRENGDTWVAGRLLMHRALLGRVFRLVGYDAMGNKRLEDEAGVPYLMRPGFAPSRMAKP